MSVAEADVVIVGGGIAGVAIARELSRYRIAVTLVERAGELAAGSSKATLGHIYTGLNMVGSMILKSLVLPPGTPLTVEALHDPAAMLSRWSEDGFSDWPTVLDELTIPYRVSDLLIVAKDPGQISDLEKYVMLGGAAGGIYNDFERIGRDAIFQLEPNLNPDIVTALHATDQVLDVFPPGLVLAIAENAAHNGVQFMLNAEVTGIRRSGPDQIVETSAGEIRTRFIINAAGGWAARIADMGGQRDWELKFNKTQLIILDRRLNGLVHGTVRWPNQPGRIELVQARTENILVECGTYDPTDRPDDTGNDRDTIRRGLTIGQSLVPAISDRDIVAAFTGVRTFNTRTPSDHIVEFPPDNPAFLNVVIRLPGFIGAWPMARHVVKLLAGAGLALESNPHFDPMREPIHGIHAADPGERRALVAGRSEYGHIICRCEQVSEAEILDAIGRGATTLDGIKFRTRASMGRCQGNFCNATMASLLSRTLQQPLSAVTKKGGSSRWAGDDGGGTHTGAAP